MSYQSVLQYEPLRSLDSATLTGVYLPIGTPLAHPSTIIKIVNASTVLVTISIDGVSDYDVVPAGGFYLYDNTANSPANVSGIFQRQNTQFYIKGAAGTGLVYLVTLFLGTVG